MCSSQTDDGQDERILASSRWCLLLDRPWRYAWFFHPIHILNSPLFCGLSSQSYLWWASWLWLFTWICLELSLWWRYELDLFTPKASLKLNSTPRLRLLWKYLHIIWTPYGGRVSQRGVEGFHSGSAHRKLACGSTFSLQSLKNLPISCYRQTSIRTFQFRSLIELGNPRPSAVSSLVHIGREWCMGYEEKSGTYRQTRSTEPQTFYMFRYSHPCL